ncbi:MAG TPA: twin-arginine translocase TatA/TatE family subunit [Solirubrobacteraceae bacterium]|jgi:sec-independent protein translocase protein TatA|nr:twin-arginine translocase TatA/TatE family subunit [Solirubrobacteraceae bacterium]
MFRSPPVDIIVVLIIVLLIMGPKRLPGIGRGLGQGMREFKDGITGHSKDDEDKPTISQATPMPESTPGSSEPAATPGSGSAGSERS